MRSALKETKIRNVNIEETKAYQTFSRICPDVNLKEIMGLELESELVNKIVKAMSQNCEAISLYIRKFVLKQIEYWKHNASSNAQNFSAMFHSQYHDTGTPYNDGTYPANLKMLWDPGTIGEALHIIEQKSPPNGIHLLSKTRPKEVLEEVLKKFFQAGSDFTAIIDGGAQLRGLDNLSVARSMIEHVKCCRPDIKAVDFFMRDSKGRDQLMTLEIGAQEPIPYDRCNLSPKVRLAYFDQRHGFAANIPQKINGKGLILPGTKHTLSRLLQEVFRMRGVKMFKKFLGIENDALSKENLDQANLENTQTVEFALTPTVSQLIAKGEKPTLRNIICFTIANEAKIGAEQNYQAYRKKMQNVVRRSVLDEILSSESVSKMLQIFQEFESVL